MFAPAIPGFLSCESEGNLPGCLYKFDDKDAQCDEGREGEKAAIFEALFHFFNQFL